MRPTLDILVAAVAVSAAAARTAVDVEGWAATRRGVGAVGWIDSSEKGLVRGATFVDVVVPAADAALSARWGKEGAY